MRRLILLVAVFFGVLPCFAQHVGDSVESVRKARGEPQMKRGTTWIYADGAKVIFKDGVVASVTGVSENVAVEVRSEPRVVATPGAPSASRPEQRSNTATTQVTVDKAKGPHGFEKMGFFAIILLCAAVCTMVVCRILLIVRAFRTGMWWGLGTMFIPIVPLLFVVSHWDETKKIVGTYFLSAVCGVGIAVAAVL